MLTLYLFTNVKCYFVKLEAEKGKLLMEKHSEFNVYKIVINFWYEITFVKTIQRVLKL